VTYPTLSAQESRAIVANRWVRLAVPLGVFALVVAVGIWGALQPAMANHFGYAVPGNDGLPDYVFANGRRYQSQQVCAGADWCLRDQAQYGIPRCYTQADLERTHEWPLDQVASMSTLFGAPHAILQRTGEVGVTTPFIVEDGPECYVMYGLEGGP
jgi:hypothetical protein